MSKTNWTNEAVDRVLRREIEIRGLDLKPYGVGEHSWTGGPVLRGPWGSMAGMRGADFDKYETLCRQFVAAHVHGFLVARRQRCEQRSECLVHDKFCTDCGGAVE